MEYVNTNQDVEFLRALFLDPQRIPLYLRDRCLVDDGGKVLLMLSPKDAIADKRPWESMRDKINAMFCVQCHERAESGVGICDPCRERTTTDLVRIRRDTR